MKLIERLQNVSSRSEKENILKTATEIEQQFLKLVYNSNIKFGVKNISLISFKLKKEVEIDLIDFLNKLSKNPNNSTENRLNIFNFATANNYEYLMSFALKKNCSCGISVKTLNKVFGSDFIPEFKVQLAKSAKIEQIKFPVIGGLKYDGVRIIILKQGTQITFKTRNGKEFLFPRLKQQIEKISDDIMLDGELAINEGKQVDRTNISGIVNSAIHGTPIVNDYVICYLFDAMHMPDFLSSNCNQIYSNRHNLLRNTISWNLLDYPVALGYTLELANINDMNKFYYHSLRLGYEGVILKHSKHLYKFKRSIDWIKLKPIKTVDLKCIDIVPGKGKYEGMIGSLTCEGEIDELPINVNIGPGLSDFDRALSEDHYLDKTIEAKYNSITRDSKTGKYSLFLSRYVTVRGDK